MELPCTAKARLRFRPVVRTLRDDDAAGTLRQIEADAVGRCVLPWVPLMHGGGEASTIEEWKRVAGAEPDSRLRTVYGALALVFAELAGRDGVWKQALEGWNMRESTVIGGWIAEGRVEGRAEGLQAAIRRVLRKRLCDPVPGDLDAAVGAVNDPDELDRLLDAAVAADSLDAFRAALRP